MAQNRTANTLARKTPKKKKENLQVTLTSQRDLTNLVVGEHPHTSHNTAKHTNNKIKKTGGNF